MNETIKVNDAWIYKEENILVVITRIDTHKKNGFGKSYRFSDKMIWKWDESLEDLYDYRIENTIWLGDINNHPKYKKLILGESNEN